VPIRLEVQGPLMVSSAYGRLTDDELLAHYAAPEFQAVQTPWRELVDGREITDMAVTPNGQMRLAGLASTSMDRLRGGRVAMVASTDLTYGMFRMWQLRRESLEFEVRVYRELEPALAWLKESVSAP